MIDDFDNHVSFCLIDPNYYALAVAENYDVWIAPHEFTNVLRGLKANGQETEFPTLFTLVAMAGTGQDVEALELTVRIMEKHRGDRDVVEWCLLARDLIADAGKGGGLFPAFEVESKRAIITDRNVIYGLFRNRLDHPLTGDAV